MSDIGVDGPPTACSEPPLSANVSETGHPRKFSVQGDQG